MVYIQASIGLRVMRFCPSYLVFFAIIVVLGGMSMLSACGKKGPLYLPPEEALAAPVPKPIDTPNRSD